ncbi:hypothetical protein FLO80_10900 [Aquicoccus porphyridii]|uniref:Uncharacterized protein n=1 Tax=Aquicoccus porphyridii TaxID=1852029 RepID=A0A5A9ZCD0_9RHOB|nr:hypothetical protein [Aquicoccus porphyridii]KAA0914873.1 hypothetical protein FLO80_10900 [Aquicoccus porphyridii]RAI52581.1 hypothetical protein DOO74_17350 [Rhodobacteraceae bacterium AsT-22]
MVRRLTIKLRQRVVSFAARLLSLRSGVVLAEEYDPDELIAGITVVNSHDAVDFGPPVGRERLNS